MSVLGSCFEVTKEYEKQYDCRSMSRSWHFLSHGHEHLANMQMKWYEMEAAFASQASFCSRSELNAMFTLIDSFHSSLKCVSCAPQTISTI